MFKLDIDADNVAVQTGKKQRSILHGTGLTKELATKAQKAFEEQQSGSSTLAPSDIKVITDNDSHSLPSTLVDPSITPDEFQQRAIDGLVNSQFGVVIGAAGTGKSTMQRWLLEAIMKKHKNPIIRLCAFTGRAVQQIKRGLPQEFHVNCDTIHGLLEYKPVIEERVDDFGNLKNVRIFRPTRTANTPLDANIIIIDEGGMNPIDLHNNIMVAIREGARVYIFGDINQLPPVQGRSVLGFAMQAWPTYELQRIHRTKEASITDGAWDILNGRMPSAIEGKVVLQRISDYPNEAVKEVIGIVNMLSQPNAKTGKAVFDPLRDAIITPQNGDPNKPNFELGQMYINERLTSMFNPPRYIDEKHNVLENPRIMVHAGRAGMRAFAVGDKVMVTSNDREAGLTNGMIGVIQKIDRNEKYRGQQIADHAMNETIHLGITTLALDAIADHADKAFEKAKEETDAAEEKEMQASHVLTVKFQNVEDPQSFATVGAVNSLQHAYAFTCHKSQGGEYPVVIIIVHSCHKISLSREWLYTAWTRAQSKIILLYNSRGIMHALNMQHITGKTLEEKAKQFIALNDKAIAGDESVKLPILPEPGTLVDYDKKFTTYAEVEDAGIRGKKDCSVVALALLASISYNEAYLIMQKRGRRPDEGANMAEVGLAFKDAGFSLHPIFKKEVSSSAMTLRKICDTYPIGKYLIHINNHVLALINGRIEDFTDGQNNRVHGVYLVTADKNPLMEGLK